MTPRDYYIQILQLLSIQPPKDVEWRPPTRDQYLEVLIAAGFDPGEFATQVQLEALLSGHSVQHDPRVFHFGDVSSAGILVDAFREVTNAAIRRSYVLPEPPCFGLLPFGEVNGLALRIPDSAEHIVAIDPFALEFFSTLATAISILLPMEAQGIRIHYDDADKTRELWAAQADTNEWAIRAFVYLLLQSLAGKGVRTRIECPEADMRRFLLDKSDLARFAMQQLLSAGPRLFLCGHEFAHILQGHLKGAARSHFAVGRSLIEMEQPAQGKELEADALGAELAAGAIAAARPSTAADMLAAIDLFFSGTMALELLSNMITGSVAFPALVGGRTHPPMRRRQQNVLAGFRATFGEEEYAASMGSLVLAVRTGCVVVMSRALVLLKLEGKTPSPNAP